MNWISRTLTMFTFVCLAVGMLWAQAADMAVPKAVPLDTKGKDYLKILDGPPETHGMESGLVILAPGKSVGIHSTKRYEEMLVVLGGRGEMRITAGPILSLSAGTAAYCPPRTEHNVFNTGADTLRYVYIVSPTAPPDSGK